MTTKVVNSKNSKYDIYIGRPSEFGNPFKIGLDGNREEVIAKFEAYLLSDGELLKKIHSLKDKVLGCWCKPKACHGDVFVKLLDKNNDMFEQ